MKTLTYIGYALVILGIVTVCVGAVLEGHAWQVLGSIIIIAYAELISNSKKEES